MLITGASKGIGAATSAIASETGERWTRPATSTSSKCVSPRASV